MVAGIIEGVDPPQVPDELAGRIPPPRALKARGPAPSPDFRGNGIRIFRLIEGIIHRFFFWFAINATATSAPPPSSTVPMLAESHAERLEVEDTVCKGLNVPLEAGSVVALVTGLPHADEGALAPTV